MPTDTDSPIYAVTAAETAPPSIDRVTPLTQRLDRVSLGLENMHDSLGLLVDRLQPVLPGNVHTSGDDQPEPPADGSSPLALRLHQLQCNAHYLADKLRAIATAVEL